MDQLEGFREQVNDDNYVHDTSWCSEVSEKIYGDMGPWVIWDRWEDGLLALVLGI